MLQSSNRQKEGSWCFTVALGLALLLTDPATAFAQQSTVIDLPVASVEPSVSDRSDQQDVDATALDVLIGDRRAGYVLAFASSGDEQLDALLADASFLKRFELRPPRTAAGLRRRAERDRRELEKVLRSQGFYGGKVSVRIGTTTANSPTGRAYPAVSVSFDLGPEFLVRSFDVELVDRGNQLLSITQFERDELTEIIGNRASARAVRSAEEALLVVLANGGYPFARSLGKEITVDHARADMRVQVRLNTGPRSRLGRVSVDGINRVNLAYAERQLGLRSGRFYSQAEIDAAKERLLATGLFASVTVNRADLPDADGTVPVVFNVRERDARQIRAGLTLSSLDGPSVFGELQHRNLFGEGQTAVARVELAPEELTGRLSFRWPDILPNRIDLVSDVEASYLDRSNLVVTNVTAVTALERRFNLDRTRISAGLGIEWIDERTNGTASTRHLFASAPIRLRSDLSNDRLDPTLGIKLDVAASPTRDLYDDTIQFFDVTAKVSAYTPLPIPGTSLAGWAAGRSIFGEKAANLPLSKRVFAGGQGSVRAFSRDGIAPRDATGAPSASGGQSVVEGGVELRHRVSERLGYTIFGEGAVASNQSVPDSLDDPFLGVGVGARYYSPLGPIRFDLAAPVSEELDWRNIQLNVGLGQAF